MSVWKDIKSGALPATEIPGFWGWAMRKLAWAILFVAIGGGAAVIEKMLAK